MTVRSYEPRDLPACRGLWEELVQWHCELYGRAEIGGAGFDAHLERVGAENIWVAELDGQVVGFAGLIVRGCHGEVEPVVVARSNRRQGAGRR